MELQQSQPVLHSLDMQEKTTVPMIPVLVGGVLIILAGIFTGYVLVRPSGSTSNAISGLQNEKSSHKVFGAPDEKSFRDYAEGELQISDKNDEGTHKLIRPGGESQTVHLTSSVLDLNQFVGKKIKIWGETFAAKKAGWFMDVGRVELLD